MTEDKRRTKERDILEAPDWIHIGKMFPAKTSVQCRDRWIELEFLRQQERVREKIREIDPTFTFSPPIDVEKIAEEFWTDSKIFFDGDLDTTTTAPAAATEKRAGTKKTALTQKSVPLALTPDELDKAWKQYRWTPERIMILKRVIDRYRRHPAVLAQMAKKLGARPQGSATTYERLVRSMRQDRLKSSSDTTKKSFLWSKEYDQFLASRMALVGVKYKSQLDAFNDVASVFDIKTSRLSV
ncbi:hypothetical protein BG003_004467, partial [Podila horticola]